MTASQHADLARGQRARVTLDAMSTVALDVAEIVDDAGDRGGDIKQQCRQERVDRAGVKECARKEERREHEGVLNPNTSGRTSVTRAAAARASTRFAHNVPFVVDQAM